MDPDGEVYKKIQEDEQKLKEAQKEAKECKVKVGWNAGMSQVKVGATCSMTHKKVYLLIN